MKKQRFINESVSSLVLAALSLGFALPAHAEPFSQSQAAAEINLAAGYLALSRQETEYTKFKMFQAPPFITLIDKALAAKDSTIVTDAIANGADSNARGYILSPSGGVPYSYPALSYVIRKCDDGKLSGSLCYEIEKAIAMAPKTNLNNSVYEFNGSSFDNGVTISMKAGLTPKWEIVKESSILIHALSSPKIVPVILEAAKIKGNGTIKLKEANVALSNSLNSLSYLEKGSPFRAQKLALAKALVDGGINVNTSGYSAKPDNALQPLAAYCEIDVNSEYDRVDTDPEAVKFLLVQGIDPNSKDPSRKGTGTALERFLRCKAGGIQSASLLLKAGANVDSIDVDGNTLLLIMAKECRPDAVRLLIANNADLTVKDKTTFKRAEDYAIESSTKGFRYNVSTGRVIGKRWDLDCNQTLRYLRNERDIPREPKRETAARNSGDQEMIIKATPATSSGSSAR